MERPTYIQPLPDINTTLNAGNAAMKRINSHLHITPTYTSSTGAAVNVYNKYEAYLAIRGYTYKNKHYGVILYLGVA